MCLRDKVLKSSYHERGHLLVLIQLVLLLWVLTAVTWPGKAVRLEVQPVQTASYACD